MSLKHIDTYRYDGGRTLLLGKTTESGGGGVTDILSSEINFFISLVSSIILSTVVCKPNLRHYIKVFNTNNIPTGRSIKGGE